MPGHAVTSANVRTVLRQPEPIEARHTAGTSASWTQRNTFWLTVSRTFSPTKRRAKSARPRSWFALMSPSGRKIVTTENPAWRCAATCWCGATIATALRPRRTAPRA